jgi:hypothetical protein
MWRPSLLFGLCVALVLLCGKTKTVAVSYETEGQCQWQGTDVRAGTKELNQGSMARGVGACTGQRHLNTDNHLHTPYQLRSSLIHSSPTPSCPHIVTPQPLVHMQQEDPIKRPSSLFPRTKMRNPYQYPGVVRESPDARERKEKYSKYRTRHPLRLKSRNWKAYDDDVASSSRHVLIIAA